MTQPITAFADEFGNNSFDFQNQGSHFIVATVITKTDNLDNLKSQVNEIRQKHKFQTGELKSSKVATDHSRRKRILEDIAKLDISIVSVCPSTYFIIS
jgi:predicted amino acid racemase